MAQSGYTPILIYASGTATNVPLAANMTSSASGAELALNYADGKLYYKNSSGVVTLLASSTTVTNSFSAGTTGLTPSTATTGAVTLAGTLITSNGGTGLSSYTAGDLSYYASGTALTKLAIGTAGQFLTSTGTAPQWSTLSGVAVTTFSAGTTGFTPNTATSGAITLAGTLGVANGGTGQTTFTAGRVLFGNGTSGISSDVDLFFDGSNLGIGTSSPNAPLTVNSGSVMARFRTGSATDGRIEFAYNTTDIGYISVASASLLDIYARSGVSLAFGANNAEGMRLTSIGLGIGTSSPAQKLHVNVASGNIYGQFSSGANNVYIGFEGAGGSRNIAVIESNTSLAFDVGSLYAERARIDSSGRFLIGTTSSSVTSSLLQVKTNPSSTNAIDVIGTDGTADNGGSIGMFADTMYLSANWYYSGSQLKRVAGNGSASINIAASTTDAATYISFTTGTTGAGNPTERARIDSAGQMIIGSTSVGRGDKLTVVGAGTLSTVTSSVRALLAVESDTATAQNVGGAISLGGNYDGGRTQYGAIGGFKESTTASEYGGYLAFFTRPNGDLTKERARITSGGDLLINCTDTNETTSVGIRAEANGAFSVTRSDSTSAASTLDVYSTGAGLYRFYVNLAGTVFATSTTITAISDQRLKENITDIDVGLDAVMALKPRKFDWKTGKGKNKKGDRGWIAQEFETVFPEMIQTWKDPAPEGEEPYKAVNADLIPILVKAMQEQQVIIESLKARLDAANL